MEDWQGDHRSEHNIEDKMKHGKRVLFQWDVEGELFLLDEHLRVDELLGSGAYGVVCEVTDTRDGSKHAVKKCKKVFHSRTVAICTLREVRLLRLLSHDNIVKLEFVYPPEDTDFSDLYLQFEIMEADLGGILRSSQSLSDDQFQYFMAQLLDALNYMHTSGIIHRDLKPKNILVNSNCLLKIADFGMARLYNGEGSDMVSPMTDYVTTRWYRAPEVLMSFPSYTSAVDMWSLGVIFAEMLGRVPLFQGKNTLDQLRLMMETLGKPKDSVLTPCRSKKCAEFIRNFSEQEPSGLRALYPMATDLAIDLLTSILTFDPSTRLSAAEALQHSYLEKIRGSGLAKFGTYSRRNFKEEFKFESLKPSFQQLRSDLLREVSISRRTNPKYASIAAATDVPFPFLGSVAKASDSSFSG